MDENSFKEAVRQVRQSPNRAELTAAVQTNLRALLSDPADRDLLQSLLGQADTLTRRLPDGTGEQSPDIRQAAVRCVLLLEMARDGRKRKRDLKIPILIGTAAAVAILYLFLLL